MKRKKMREGVCVEAESRVTGFCLFVFSLKIRL